MRRACTLDPTLSYDDLRAMAEGESLATAPVSYQSPGSGECECS